MTQHSSTTMYAWPTLVREKQIIGDRQVNPPVPAMLPVSHGTLWTLVRQGHLPQPIRFGRMSFWRTADILAFITKLETGDTRVMPKPKTVKLGADAMTIEGPSRGTGIHRKSTMTTVPNQSRSRRDRLSEPPSRRAGLAPEDAAVKKPRAPARRSEPRRVRRDDDAATE